MALLVVLLSLLVGCGGGRDVCRDYPKLTAPDYIQAYNRAMMCTMLSADTPRILELGSVPCPDNPRKFCAEGTGKGAEYRRECNLIVIQRGAFDTIVEHEAIHHLLDENGVPVHDHCHPAFVACDPIRPRPDCRGGAA